jgi:hypothetical protein
VTERTAGLALVDPSEIVNAVHSRRPPMMPASAALDR